MRDLRRAAKEGHHALLVSLWKFPARHPLLIAGVVGAVAFCLLFLGLVDTRSDVGELRPKIVQIERADPCVTLSEAARQRKGPRIIKRLTASCISFLDALGPLISLKLSCAILDEGGYECPKPGSEAARREVVAGSGNTPHGQPSPAPAGEKGAPGTSKPSHPHKKPTAPRQLPHLHRLRLPRPQHRPHNRATPGKAHRTNTDWMSVSNS